MSALTKVFIVLHVVLSMLFASALVVFVNQVDNYSQKATAANTAALQAKNELALAMQTNEHLLSEKQGAVNEATDRANALRAQLDTQIQKVVEINSQIQTFQNQISGQQIQLASSGAALAVSQETIKAEEGTITDLRKSGDDLQKKLTEATASASDLSNRLDVARTQLKYEKEQTAALGDEVSRLQRQLAAAPTPGAAPGAPAVGAPGAGIPSGAASPSGDVPSMVTANIRGVVKAKMNVGGVDYATISVGSADSVTKGMQFRVIDRTRQQFLGYLTVDAVEPNESSGHLSGPAVPAVQKGNEVRTTMQ